MCDSAKARKWSMARTINQGNRATKLQCEHWGKSSKIRKLRRGLCIMQHFQLRVSFWTLDPVTVWPMLCSLRAQWWALLQASMPIRQGGKLTKKVAIWSRRSCFFNTALPSSSTPCTWNTFFAKSMPTVVIFTVDAPALFKWLMTSPLWHD
jgi:hypothetical protein